MPVLEYDPASYEVGVSRRLAGVCVRACMSPQCELMKGSQAGDVGPEAVSPGMMKKVGQGLESVGDMTAGVMERFASVAVGVARAPVRIASAAVSVAKAPVVIMTHVGGLSSYLSSPNSSKALAERVSRLESQLAALDEKYTALSPRLLPATPRSLKKFTGTLTERVQNLEGRLAEHVEGYDRDFSEMGTTFAPIRASRLSLLSRERSSSDEEFHDAVQGNGNLDQSFLEEADVDAHEPSLESLAKEPLGEDGGVEVAAALLHQHEETLVEGSASTVDSPPDFEDRADAGKSLAVRTSSEPQLALQELSMGETGARPEEHAVQEVVAGDGTGSEQITDAGPPIVEEPVAKRTLLPGAGAISGDETSLELADVEEPMVKEAGAIPDEHVVQESASADKTGSEQIADAESSIVEEEPSVAGAGVQHEERAAQESFGANETGVVGLESPLRSTNEEVISREAFVAADGAKAEEHAVQESVAAEKTGSEPIVSLESPAVEESISKDPLMVEADAKCEEPAAQESHVAADKSGLELASGESLIVEEPVMKEPLVAGASVKFEERSSSDEEFHDAVQGSGNLDQSFLEEADVDAHEPSLESLAKEPLGEDGGVEVAAALLHQHEETLVEGSASTVDSPPDSEDRADAGKILAVRTSSEPQLALQEPLMGETGARPEENPVQESVAADRTVSQQIARPESPIIEEPVAKENLVTEAGAKLEESAAHESVATEQTVPELTDVGEPIVKEPLMGEAGTKPEEHAVQESRVAADTTGSEFASAEPPIVEEPVAKETLAAEAGAKLEEPAAQESAAEDTNASELADVVKEPLVGEAGARPEEHEMQESVAAYKTSSEQIAGAELSPIVEEPVAKETLVAEAGAESEESAALESLVTNEAGASRRASLESLLRCTDEEAISREPLVAEIGARSEEHAMQESVAAEKTGPEPTASAQLPTVEESIAKEPLMAEAGAKFEEPAAQQPAETTGSELGPPSTSTGAEPLAKESLMAEAGAKYERPADKTDSVPSVTKSRNASIADVLEDKHVYSESEYKAGEDFKPPELGRGSFTSFLTDPKPAAHRDKWRASSLRSEPSSGSMRLEGKKTDGTIVKAEEKSKHPFRHLRERFRHTFKPHKHS